MNLLSDYEAERTLLCWLAILFGGSCLKLATVPFAMFFDWLAKKMVARNLRLVRSGRRHRWWFVAFWVSFAVYAMTEWISLEIITGILLVCAIVARILAPRRAMADLEKLIKEKGKPDA